MLAFGPAPWLPLTGWQQSCISFELNCSLGIATLWCTHPTQGRFKLKSSPRKTVKSKAISQETGERPFFSSARIVFDAPYRLRNAKNVAVAVVVDGDGLEAPKDRLKS